jgi:hypothetical protein
VGNYFISRHLGFGIDVLFDLVHCGRCFLFYTLRFIGRIITKHGALPDTDWAGDMPRE